MLLQVPDVLTSEQVNWARQMLQAAWVDGGVTAGHQSAYEGNRQLPKTIPWHGSSAT